jgi:uncharacterized protein YheU (UPF0270 family)
MSSVFVLKLFSGQFVTLQDCQQSNVEELLQEQLEDANLRQEGTDFADQEGQLQQRSQAFNVHLRSQG